MGNLFDSRFVRGKKKSNLAIPNFDRFRGPYLSGPSIRATREASGPGIFWLALVSPVVALPNFGRFRHPYQSGESVRGLREGLGPGFSWLQI